MCRTCRLQNASRSTGNNEPIGMDDEDLLKCGCLYKVFRFFREFCIIRFFENLFNFILVCYVGAILGENGVSHPLRKGMFRYFRKCLKFLIFRRFLIGYGL